jgi:hypothetical protein
MNSVIVIKPHHFLDIIKLYGSGIKIFVPDKEYGHDFYRVGNIILKNKETSLVLTSNGDDICKPCKYFENRKCIDTLGNDKHYNSKEEWNKMIDTKLFDQLGLKEGQRITALHFCCIVSDKLRDIYEIWEGEPPKKTESRKKNLFEGVYKYIGNNS